MQEGMINALKFAAPISKCFRRPCVYNFMLKISFRIIFFSCNYLIILMYRYIVLIFAFQVIIQLQCLTHACYSLSTLLHVDQLIKPVSVKIGLEDKTFDC